MAVVNDPRRLGTLPIFAGLSDQELTTINELLRATKFRAGASIITAEQPGEVAYVVLSGTLKVSTMRSDGTDVILAILGRGEIAGELSLVDRAERSATVTTLETSELIWFDRASYARLRSDMPRICDNLIVMLAQRLRAANGQIQALATLDVHGRVARQLLALAEQYGVSENGQTTIELRLTQSDLAALCGATRVRVNQALGSFKKLGYLSDDGKHRITLLNSTALAEYTS